MCTTLHNIFYYVMNLIFTITYFAWFISEILLNRLLRLKKTDKQSVDKGSLSLIWITIILGIFISIFISSHYYFPLSPSSFVQFAGLLLIGIGVALRLSVIISLGKFFTVEVTIRKNHKLKKDGFYKYLRHPSYFSSLLSFVGFGISLNNWISLSFITIAILAVFIYRIKVEEKVLIRQFGAEYIEYKKTTMGFIPFIY